jgi:hypothetical protein
MTKAKRNHETWELAWTRPSLSVVGWDKELSTGWTSFASWSSCHRVHQEVQALSQEVLDMGLFIHFLSQLKDELNVLLCESKWGRRRRFLHHIDIHFFRCVRCFSCSLRPLYPLHSLCHLHPPLTITFKGVSCQLGGISSSTMQEPVPKKWSGE